MNIFPLRLIPARTNFNFMALRWPAVILAGLLFVLSIGLIAVKGFNYALDFTGGTVVEVRFDKPADVDGVRDHLEAAGYAGAQVQSFGSGSDLLIRLQPQAAAEGESTGDANNRTAADVLRAISLEGNAATVMSTEFVGPQVGKELAMNGVYAALFVMIGFLIYIGFRFETKFAIVAILTTLFDVLIVAGYFSFSGREFDLTVLAGLLAVMGFSINDTIVVFDRVRENFRADGDHERLDQPDPVAHHHHLGGVLPVGAGAVPVRRRLAGRPGPEPDDRRGGRYAVLDLHRLPVADHGRAGGEQG